jgi:expansin (peptidoglycan-binding protein)
MAQLLHITLFLLTIMIVLINVNAFNGDATFFYTGVGACGKKNSNSDFIFALPARMFDPSPGGNPNRNRNCGRKAKVTRGKKSVTVTCVDRCAGCKPGDIDLSPAAFNKIAKPEEGRVKVTWNFIN